MINYFDGSFLGSEKERQKREVANHACEEKGLGFKLFLNAQQTGMHTPKSLRLQKPFVKLH